MSWQFSHRLWLLLAGIPSKIPEVLTLIFYQLRKNYSPFIDSSSNTPSKIEADPQPPWRKRWLN
jgi:hypothetical protein